MTSKTNLAATALAVAESSPTRLGFALEATAGSAGRLLGYGQWAVTAP